MLVGILVDGSIYAMPRLPKKEDGALLGLISLKEAT